jgi:hypothetical protein
MRPKNADSAFLNLQFSKRGLSKRIRADREENIMNRASQKPGSLASLKLKTRCEMCGATNRKKDAAPLEPALDPSGQPKTLCRECRIGSGDLLAQPRRIYVEVSGGVVQAVQNLPNNCNWIVLDWDNFESDPVETWARTDEQTRKFIQEEYADSYCKIMNDIRNSKKIRT